MATCTDEAEFGFALVAFGCIVVDALECGDEFVDVAVACDRGDFAVFYEDEGCHAAVGMRCEFDVTFVFDGADGFRDGDYDWNWVEVACL